MPNVYAQVEPVKVITDMMEAKKRDINGGVFSFEKVEDHYIHDSKKRESCMLGFQFFYLNVVKFIIFFMPSILIFSLQYAI